ncbi:MAG: P-loop NTPase fold protein [Pirellulaceae bacterium]
MWSDRDTDQDFLGFGSYVSVLAETCTMKDLAPLTLGIFGAWGSGKTSLMRMLQAKVDSTPGVNAKTLWFNAWRYEGREEAQSALIHAVLAKLAEDKTLWQDAKETFDRIKKGASVLKLAKFMTTSVITMTPQISEFIDCFKEESEKIAETMEAFDKDFESLLAKAKIDRIVVFIDDLDRCSSAKVIETFETIKLFLNTPACTFVIGADAAKIQHAVGEVYKVNELQRQKDFLEKIVQIPFTIPQQDLRDIACYVGMLIIGRNLDQAHWPILLSARRGFYTCTGSIEEEICRWPEQNKALIDSKLQEVKCELSDVMPYVHVLARGLRGNPRQIKRFLNIISLRRRLANENGLDVEQDMLIKLAVLEYVWEDFFNAIAETVDPETGRSALIDEVIQFSKLTGRKESESKLVMESMGRVGLVEYLIAEPIITGEINLNDYLFLAQTSLSRGRAHGLQPADEKAKALAVAIESDDRIRSQGGAKQAAAQEPALAASVVRILLADLTTAKEALLRTHIINGLEEICRKHREQYQHAVDGLSQLEPKDQDAVSLSATTLLNAAEKSGVMVSSELKDKFKGSSLAAAFATQTRKKSPKRQGA